MPLPDYKNSIVNLMSSILGAYGKKTGYQLLKSIKGAEFSGATNIVLLVIDGLGYEYLLKNGNESTLKKHLRSKLTSVFPSTTASAMTSFFTGLTPQEHGLTGWFTYLKEMGVVSTILPFTTRYGESKAEACVEPKKIFTFKSVFERINVNSYIISHRDYVHSEFNKIACDGAKRKGYSTLNGYFSQIVRTIKSSKKKKFICAYWGKFDSICHREGVGSKKALSHFQELDKKFAKFIVSLKGTGSLVIVTSDHGQIESKKSEMINLKDHPQLQECLTLPLCGEPRTAYCYVRPSKIKIFENYVRKNMGNYCAIYKSDDLIKKKYFGLHQSHPRLFERVGDYTLIMKDNYIIRDFILGEKEHFHIGNHGGTSKEEMLIPLIVVKIN